MDGWMDGWMDGLASEGNACLFNEKRGGEREREREGSVVSMRTVL